MSTVFISPPSSPAPTSAPLLTRPVQSVSIFDDDMSFHSYCIVCDKIIVPIKEKEGSPGANGAAKKKKKAQGTIRIRNPDGTTTTRTANGQKVTRPVLKRNQTSQGRLAAVAANNSAAKLQNPLPRTKTSDSLASNKYESRSCPPTPAKEPPFRSSIYCCRECAAADAGRQDAKFDQLARNLSYDFGSPIGSTFGFTPDPIHTHIVTDHVNLGPPSPLCVSGSDTESSDRSNPEAIAASSAPTAPEYFRIPRQTPEEAWMENQRQRRGSMHNSTYRLYAMTRQQSHQSHY
ncbi:hypothetical protein TREMEDRAFT_71147, partial [Tremella mesenterica DSM 1558]|uniref:uncharacterized protein n=1 Tax=Tremella mesenterica (strain ATCC 24925 / CBS 8224 / DSM 1558 / NBRC 9311 / NRRL Y-6157 / RJB 2259-6 / UBC 559-6) TaxID=578456 RepID=UPI0003F48D92